MRHQATSIPARANALLQHLALAVAAFLPQLLERPGVWSADTKTYLYLEPGRYLRQSVSMWDPGVGLGTVTHQQIGYLFPMGPFFWATHALHVHTWVAQRLWVGLILLTAAGGTWRLARLVGLRGPGPWVAALSYMLTPYTLQYLGHISVILLAYAALPWLVVLVERAATGGGWPSVAVVALVVAAMGSVNATSAIYVGIGPLLWLLYGAVTRRLRWGAVGAVFWRTALLGGLVSLWWVVALAVEGGYGIDVVRYTESVQAVSTASLSSEVARGLGYWYFYGGDSFGPWVSAMPQYTQELWLLAVGYTTAVVAVAGAVLVRWRYRMAFVSMAVVGMVLAVGAHPFATPSPVGRLLKAFLSSSSVGMGLRSTDRATPLVLLALAMLAGALITALWRHARWQALALSAMSIGAVVVANPALWNGTGIPTTFVEPELAHYELRAAAYLDHQANAGAVLGLPGQPFATTFAGTTVDPLWPALLQRPFVTREQQVMGSLATEDFLYALDDPIQKGVADPGALAAMARLAGAGDLLVQNDLAFTRYNQPDPAVLWAAVQPPTADLATAVGFGRTRTERGHPAVVDEQTYTLPATTAPIPSLAVVGVTGARALVRAEPASSSLVVDGDAVGLDNLGGSCLLAGRPAVVYAGTLDTHPGARGAVVGPSTTLVVTDSNRRQAFRWDNLQDVAGPTLASRQLLPTEPADHPLELFTDAPADSQTTAEVVGVSSVNASTSGNPFQYLPEDRPVGAIDGTTSTAWQVGPFLDPRGQWWQVRLARPLRTGAITLVQAQTGQRNQWITAVTISFDGRNPLRVRLGPSSRQELGQVVRFSPRTFRTLRVTIDATNVSTARALQGGLSPVGLAEVSLPGVRAEEHVVMPSDLLHTVGPSSSADRLAFVMTRLRVAPATSRTDPEPSLDRRLWLPTPRTFEVTGTARIDVAAADSTVDRLVGRPGTDSTGVVAESNGRLQGDVAARASAALDGDPATAWTSPLGPGGQVGKGITVLLAAPISFDHLDLQVVVDGRHSVPSSLRVTTDSGSAVVNLPTLPRQLQAGGTDPVTVSFPPLRGRSVTVTVVGIKRLRATDSYTGGNDPLPVSLAELGIPGVRVQPMPATLPSSCRDDLLRVDGRPVWLSVTGSTGEAQAASGLGVRLCGPSAGGLALGAGDHLVQGASGAQSGFDLDQLVLDSARGGGPQTGDRPGALVPPGATAGPVVRVLGRSPTSADLRVSVPAGAKPFWLVLGQSLNRGWHARVAGGADLGPPVLVDGFANGWLVSPPESGATMQIALRWTPQRGVDVALVVSLLSGLACLVIAAAPLWRRRRTASTETTVGAGGEEPDLPLPSEPSGRPSQRRVVMAAIGAGLVTAVVLDPWAGLGVAGGTALCALVPAGPPVLGWGALAAMVGTLLAMVAGQAVGGYVGDGRWPSHFEAAAVLTWLALGLVVAQAAARWARRSRSGDDGNRASAVEPGPMLGQ